MSTAIDPNLFTHKRCIPTRTLIYSVYKANETIFICSIERFPFYFHSAAISLMLLSDPDIRNAVVCCLKEKKDQ